MIIYTCFITNMKVIGDLADDPVFPQIFAPFFGDAVFTVENPEDVSGDASSGIAVAGDVDGFQNPRFEVPLMVQGAVNADRQRLFGDPAFAEFGDTRGGLSFADGRQSFGGFGELFQMLFNEFEICREADS